MKRNLLPLCIFSLFPAYNAMAAGYTCNDLIEYLRCFDGYHMAGADNKICESCPAGSYCNSSNDVPFSCAAETGNQFATSAPGAKNAQDCYITCNDSSNPDGTTKIYWQNDPSKFMCDCPYYEQMGPNGCEPCDVDGALSYVDGNGNCVVAECKPGTHPNGNKCDANIIDCTDSITNASGATITWDAQTGAYSACVVNKCESGYHVSETANACVTDIETCELAHGTGERTWNHNTNTWGKCIATTCFAGYTNDPTETNAADPTQCGECSNKYGPNGEVVVSSYANNCEIAMCMNEGQQYVLDNNQCRLICTGSDETGERHWDEKLQECVHTCYEGYTLW